jgi:dihydrofolate reductase
MIISAIVARAENRIIGRENDLPWHLPGDLKWFKSKTAGRHVIMGRKSFESLSKPLPNRVNIVITRDQSWYHSGVVIVKSIPEALNYARKAGEEEVFILGGGKIYDQLKSMWHRLYLTEVHAIIEGDTFFPEIDLADYILSFEEHHEADEKNQYAFTFKVLERKMMALR